MVIALLACWVTDKEVDGWASGNSSVTDIDLTDERVALMEALMEEIPAGTFTMGCTAGQSNCESDETVHEVTLTHDFYLMRYELTQEQFEAVVGYQPSEFSGCPDCPVERVSWYEAAAFANELSRLAGIEECYTCTGSGSDVECEDSANPYTCPGYRLPTEAEWEYAARCGEDTLYAGSDNIDEVAWYDSNSGNKTHPTGEKTPNTCGLYDMSGNVFEWVQDWYGDYPGSTSDYVNNGSGSNRVYRGGSWGNGPSIARVAIRGRVTPGSRSSSLGFRLARLQ